MELDIKKYLAFIALILTGFLLVNYTLINMRPKQAQLYWPNKSKTSVIIYPTPNVSLTRQNGKTTISWSGYGEPVDIQRCSSVELNSWETISRHNSSGTYVDNNAQATKAFYRLTYPASL